MKEEIRATTSNILLSAILLKKAACFFFFYLCSNTENIPVHEKGDFFGKLQIRKQSIFFDGLRFLLPTVDCWTKFDFVWFCITVKSIWN